MKRQPVTTVTMQELERIASEALDREKALTARLAQLLPIEEAVLEWLAALDDPEDYGYRIDDAYDTLKARARILDEQRRQEEQAT